MIFQNPQLLPEDQVKRIRRWLQEPAFADLVKWLADRAAFYTADAGNALVESRPDGIEGARVEAEEAADKAREYLHAHDILVGLINPEFQFATADLKPKPLATTPNEQPD